MTLIDISPVISADIAVFPGDTPYNNKILMDYALGHHLKLSTIETTVHLGAHADASNHYHADGLGIDKRDLSHYLGRCQVIQVDIEPGARIYPKDIESKAITCKRVLFRTGSFPDPNNWNSDFNSLSPDLINDLARKGVRTVGIDTPSIDPETSKALESHQAIYNNDIAVLEGLVLEHVEEGVYFLIALPLKLKNADASPVRAVLMKEPFDWD